MRRGVWALWLLLGAAVCALAPVLAYEESVRSGANARFLAPDLDVGRWLRIFEGESREIFRSRKEIVEELGLSPGLVVADVGAGTGVFIGLLAEQVGQQGKVYAVEIAPRFIEYLRERAEQQGLTQVKVVVGTPRSVELPDASIDVALVSDTYHHFEYPVSMLSSLYAALRPGGQLAVIDFERIPGVSRKWVLDHVRAGKEVFVAEIEAAGFELVEEIPVSGLVENYMLRFQRPPTGQFDAKRIVVPSRHPFPASARNR